MYDCVCDVIGSASRFVPVARSHLRLIFISLVNTLAIFNSLIPDCYVFSVLEQVISLQMFTENVKRG